MRLPYPTVISSRNSGQNYPRKSIFLYLGLFTFCSVSFALGISRIKGIGSAVLATAIRMSAEKTLIEITFASSSMVSTIISVNPFVCNNAARLTEFSHDSPANRAAKPVPMITIAAAIRKTAKRIEEFRSTSVRSPVTKKRTASTVRVSSPAVGPGSHCAVPWA